MLTHSGFHLILGTANVFSFADLTGCRTHHTAFHAFVSSARFTKLVAYLYMHVVGAAIVIGGGMSSSDTSFENSNQI